MSKDTKGPPLDDEQIVLQEAYANIYNEITKPKQVFVDSQYFRKKWVPLLGHSLGWLIIALRQHCYWNRQTGEMRNWCVVSQEEIATEVGIDTRTLRRLLKQKYADKFVLEIDKRYRYDSKLGKQVRHKTFYRIRMDDPLTLEDEILLRQRLAEEMSGYGIDPETGQLDMLKLLDRPLHLADKMSARSNQAEKTPDSPANHLPDNLSADTPHLPDKLSARSPDLPDNLSAILYTGQNVRNHDSTYMVVQSSKEKIQQQQQYSHDGAVVHLDKLENLTITTDQVLVPISTDNDSFSIETLTNVVKRDLLAAGAYDEWHMHTSRHEVFYSIAHALGQGGDNWTPEEVQKLRERERLERELGERFNRLGAFSLEEALAHYFTPDLVQQFLTDVNDAERHRIKAWITHTRQAQGLKNPAGFLRSKIERGEAAP